jgi:hypothetical protein
VGFQVLYVLRSCGQRAVSSAYNSGRGDLYEKSSGILALRVLPERVIRMAFASGLRPKDSRWLTKKKSAQGEKMSGQIFISYRRDDSSASAGRLYDHRIRPSLAGFDSTPEIPYQGVLGTLSREEAI